MPALNRSGNVLDEVSDAVDHGGSRLHSLCLITYLAPSALSALSVNVLKGGLWDEEPEFVPAKDKNSFRQYDTACERVKAFYKEQHGWYCSSTRAS